MAETTGMADLRAENISAVVTGFALQSYRFKQLCMVQSSSAWKETYWKETAADLVGGTGSDVRGIPRLANFPYGEVSWTEASSRHLKHGMEGVISWEDERTNDIDTIARTLLRIGRAVASSVDTEIWNCLSETTFGSTPRTASTDTNLVTIAAGNEWDSATVANRDPVQDILNAKKEIEVDNYDPDVNGFLLLTPKDAANLLGNANIRNAGQFYTDAVTRNGVIGKMLGLTIIKSNNVYDDWSAVVLAKESLTWKAASPLVTKTIDDPGIKKTIRSWEVGTCQLKNPEAVCLITNTQA